VRVPQDFPSVKQALKNVTEGHILHVYPGAISRECVSEALQRKRGTYLARRE
jgi:hypothetical protein